MSDFEFKSETQQNTNVEQLEQQLSSYIRVGLVALLSNFGFKGLFKTPKNSLWQYSKHSPLELLSAAVLSFFLEESVH